MKTGIFGGTFNPIHLSHLYLATEYRQVLSLDRILFIPTCTPPHKSPPDLASAEHRLQMCRLAVGDGDTFQVCSWEVERGEISYTWKTVEHLAGQYPEDELYLLMGADMFLSVQEWKHPERIWAHAVLCAAARQEGERERLLNHQRSLKALGARCKVLSMQPKPLSSTQIRKGIAAGKDVSGLLPKAVWRYIREHRLYGWKE